MKTTIPFTSEKIVEYRPNIIKLAKELKITPKEALDFVRGYGLKFKSDAALAEPETNSDSA